MPLKEIQEILKIHSSYFDKNQKNYIKAETAFNDLVVSLVEDLKSPLTIECIKAHFLLVHAKLEVQPDTFLEVKSRILIYNEFIPRM